MRMYDLIEDKKRGILLSKEQIEFLIDGYLRGEIPDYQVSALLMAIYFNGMKPKEITDLTTAMAYSGDMIDLSGIDGTVVDKHSTGGVGDKTTFVVAAIAASLGVKIAKMSGRGLGHTGGTIDKMESIPGLKTQMKSDEFFDIVNRVGACIIGQTGNLAPADKKLYALRDVTATVDSIPLIASSIMSKKLAAGAHGIVLDVKVGSGAFMKDIDSARDLASTMVEIGKSSGREVVALLTSMDRPLGNTVGNSLEMKEVVETLMGNGPEDLTELSVELAARMLMLAEICGYDESIYRVRESISDMSAYKKFIEMISAQGGDVSIFYDLEKFASAEFCSEIISDTCGTITSMNTEDVGIAAAILGAGRAEISDKIDYSAGITLLKKTGDFVKKGEALAKLQTSDKNTLSEAEAVLRKSYSFEGELKRYPLIIEIVE